VLLVILLVASIVLIIFATTKLNLHAFLTLLLVGIFFGITSGMPLADIVSSIESGFGGTIGKIGIVIVAGTVIGTFLEKSGGAFSMAESVLKRIGEKRVPLAMAIVGYFVSIPVFADSGFVILHPLNKALTKRANLSMATTAIALVLGLMASHTLVPPTPGPIAAAGILNADLGLVILFGVPISFLVALVGWQFAVRFASRVHIDPDPDHSEADIAELLARAPKPSRAFAPILLPIILIVLRSFADYPSHPFGEGWLATGISFLGTPLIALLIGIGIALTLPKHFDRKMLSTTGWVGKGLLDAALIILITGAGGAFGKVLQNSGIADVIGASLSDAHLGLWLPFIVSAAIRAAQGSATVALITTASIFAPLAGSMGMDTGVGAALLVLAIGAGSNVGSHANDSMFWILTQMTGMDVRTGYRLQTVGSSVIGFAAACIIWAVSLVAL